MKIKKKLFYCAVRSVRLRDNPSPRGGLLPQTVRLPRVPVRVVGVLQRGAGALRPHPSRLRVSPSDHLQAGGEERSNVVHVGLLRAVCLQVQRGLRHGGMDFAAESAALQV